MQTMRQSQMVEIRVQLLVRMLLARIDDDEVSIHERNPGYCNCSV